MDGSGLHGKSERPSYFTGWLAVPDSTLPPKGVGYRRNTHESETQKEVKNMVITTFASCDLWKHQGFSLDSFPQALAEGDFAVPSAKAHLQCNDSRKNWTDAQETAQWLSGEAVYGQILKSLLGPLDDDLERVFVCSPGFTGKPSMLRQQQDQGSCDPHDGILRLP